MPVTTRLLPGYGDQLNGGPGLEHFFTSLATQWAQVEGWFDYFNVLACAQLVPGWPVGCHPLPGVCWAVTWCLWQESSPGGHSPAQRTERVHREQFRTGMCPPNRGFMEGGWKISDSLRWPESRAQWFWGLWVLAEASAVLRAQTHVGPARKTRAHLILIGTISSLVKYWIPIGTAARRIAKNHRLLKEIRTVNLE